MINKTDIRQLPSYRITEASHYLRIPVSTIRCWIFGQNYPISKGKSRSQPLIKLPDKDLPLLSFLNLCEIHVLDAIRREHEISLQKVRTALEYVIKVFGDERPLIDKKFETDGVDLFVSEYSQLINVTKGGQIEMKECLQAYLKRIEYDKHGIVSKMYPFTRKREFNEPKNIVIDPHLSFGRPVVRGTGIATLAIAERYKAGESVGELAADYSIPNQQIEEAIRCELQLKTAA
jgi:uncharacterized protein (DUF433 family)